MHNYPFIFSDAPAIRLRRHLVFWFFWWIFFGLLYALSPYPALSFPERIPFTMIETLLFMVSHLFFTYALLLFVIPRYVVRGEYMASFAWIIVLLLASACLSALMSKYVNLPLISAILPERLVFKGRSGEMNLYLGILSGLRGGISIGGIAATIKLSKYFYLKEQRNLQLQKENTEARLQLLTAQIQPHFLFNTLNNIYSQAQVDSPGAARLVASLSEILRHMLYKGNQPLVPLDDELQILREYINLEKVRYGDRLDLFFSYPQDADGLCIAPLLLLPLVENCFKHGASHMVEQPWISLDISAEGNRMHMKLVNGRNPLVSPETNASGIGLRNVRKRLELLYPGRHELQLSGDEDVFIVNLWLDLDRQEQPGPHRQPIEAEHA